MINHTIQLLKKNNRGLFQGELFGILHSLLVNADSREAALEWTAQAIQRNVKRSQVTAQAICAQCQKISDNLCFFEFVPDRAYTI